ncbi:MAG: hypothetical protein Ct9H90mP24_0640 [Methanobacteriota archaeon]|nr:MAG: hypothetical protein Ct9H90mP24_0640 [Euryarchaeota archaeon]
MFRLQGCRRGARIHSAVEWLGEQDWSNGNVGLYGKPYEGATQWEAAAMGSQYLKTIVPISGTPALHPLLYKNGSAEARSQIMHMNYFSSTVDYNSDDLDNICPDIAEGLFAGPVTYIGGEMDPYMQNYYDERSQSTRHSESGMEVFTGCKVCKIGTLIRTRSSVAPPEQTGTPTMWNPVTRYAVFWDNGDTTPPTSGRSTTIVRAVTG